jgi:TolB-like protein/Flp pilus assembly protein TadD
VVGYSLLLITEQGRVIKELAGIVKATEQFRESDAQGKLMRIPTGDGMILVFFDDPQAPIECATEIAAALRNHPDIRLRMGIHSGPVNEVTDVSDRSNVAGAGIDTAERVMSCGDAGHILLSKRVAEDLAPYPQWRPHLHDLGECEVKHGRKIALVNFYNGEVGKAEQPRSCATSTTVTALPLQSDDVPSRRKFALVGAGALLTIFAVGAVLLWRSEILRPGHSAASQSQSIAVLPFENATNDPNAEYLAEGISEALINSLTELRELRVVARATAFHYKGKQMDPQRIGRELRATAVLSGKVRQAEDALNIQVDLIDAISGTQLWGHSYERKLLDLVTVKQAIAREVTEKLKLQLSGEEKRRLVERDTANAEAYQFYLKGRYFWNKRTEAGLEKGIRYFQQAIEADPNYALAYVGVADSYNFLGAFGIAILPPGEAIPKARSAALRALEIDASLAEAHASIAFVRLYHEWDWAGAEKAFQRAIALNPNYAPAHQWYSHLLMSRGRTSEAILSARRAAEIDPLSLPAGMNMAWQYYWSRQYDLAVECLHKILDIDPNFEQGHWGLGLAYEGKGMLEEAATEFQKAIELSGSNAVYVAALGHACAIGANKKAALEIRARLEEQLKTKYVSPYWMATLQAGLGEIDLAFQWLEKAYEERSGGLIWLAVDPRMDNLRADSRFAALLRRVGLPP